MPYEFIDGKLGVESLVVADFALLEIDGDFVVVDLLGAAHDRGEFVVGKTDRQESILGAVVGKNVGEGRGDDGAESEVGERPDGVLARRSAAEIFARDQNAGAFVARLVQHEVRILLAIRAEAPVIKDELAEAGLLDPLQELLGDDLVGVDVDAIERGYAPAMDGEWVHLRPFSSCQIERCSTRASSPRTRNASSRFQSWKCMW